MRVIAPSVNDETPSALPVAHEDSAPKPVAQIEVTMLTGGGEAHYTSSLAGALVSRGARLEVVGSDSDERSGMRSLPGLTFLNLRGNQDPDVGFLSKVFRVLQYYARLIRYTAAAEPEIFHILWNNRFQFFDRTLLMLYYKVWKKKVVLTAHNINAGRRDTNDSLLNRIGLRAQYRLADHIFVHTEKMKDELVREFNVRKNAVTVIPHGINTAVPHTSLTRAEARRRLGIRDGERVVFSFGLIRPYKGLEFLVAAFKKVIARNADLRLMIAGRPMKGCEEYWEGIQRAIRSLPAPEQVILKSEFVPDEETEVYFKAADVLVLPYTEIFQSGVLLLAYSFGLPVIASDVGSFSEDIIAGRTGFLCNPRDPDDLALKIEKYFQGGLFENLSSCRQEIRGYAEAHYSWETVASKTLDVYAGLCRTNKS